MKQKEICNDKIGKRNICRLIPRVDSLMEEKEIREMIREYGYNCVLRVVRRTLDELREEIWNGTREEIQDEIREKIRDEIREETKEQIRKSAMERIVENLRKEMRMNLTSVVNGTGIILHTGLGRAPLGEEVLRHAAAVAGGYSNLEFDLETGKRGERCVNFEETVCRVTGAEAALAVNNNAAAMLLILSSLASGGEVIVSRGELVEIGGGFRIPEIMELGGALLREVGTTNRTRPDDYRNAIGEETKALLKVHTSNYRIIGYTQETSLEKLAALGEETGLPVIQDLGSGVLIDLAKYGLAHEPMVQEAVKGGADVVAFSGDKLLGGPQAGIIVGRKKYIDKMKRHPLARALRIDKFTAAALEAVFRQYLDPDRAVERIPALGMLTRPAETVRKDAEKMAARLSAVISAGDASSNRTEADIIVQACVSRAGGGSLPEENIESYAVAVSAPEITAGELAARFRKLDRPVIGRISGEKLLLDMRTIREEEIAYLESVFRDGKILQRDMSPQKKTYPQKNEIRQKDEMPRKEGEQ